MTLEVQILVWDRHKNVEDLNRLMGLQPFPVVDLNRLLEPNPSLLITGSRTAIHILTNDKKKPAQYMFISWILISFPGLVYFILSERNIL